MNPDQDGAPITHKIKVSDIEDNVPGRIDLSDAEIQAIRSLLDLVALDGVEFVYRLRRRGGGRVHLSAQLKAAVTQTCVLSLEPVPASVDVPVELDFWPIERIDELENKTGEPGQTGPLDWPEPIVEGSVDLGPVLYETLATALDPYPKKVGVNFEWTDGGSAPESGKTGPFAALDRLRKR